MIKNRTLIVLLLMVFIISGISFAVFKPETTTENPVRFTTDSGSTGTAIPYLYVKRSSTYSYYAQANGNEQNRIYHFDDGGNFDYKDLYLKVDVDGNGTSSLNIDFKVLQVGCSCDYDVWTNLVIPEGYQAEYKGTYYTGIVEILIFESAEKSKGTEATIYFSKIAKPDFDFEITPSKITVEAGESGSVTGKVTGEKGFSDKVMFLTKTNIDGINIDYNPASVIGSGKTNIVLQVGEDVEPGLKTIKVRAKSGDLYHDDEFIIDVIKYEPAVDINKQADKTKVTVGEVVTFTITAKNSGDVDLHEVKISDTIHPALEIISTEPTANISGNDVVFDVGSLAVDETRTFKIKAEILPEAEDYNSITNTAVLTSDRVPKEQSNTVSLNFGVPGLALTKSVKNANPSFRPGGIVIYELNIRNNGSAPLYNLKINDDLPDGFYYINSKTILNNQSYDDPQVEGTQLLWEISELEAGGQLIFIYQVSIATSVKNGRHTNSAMVNATDGAGKSFNAGPAQATVTVSRGNILLWSSITGTVFSDTDNDGFYGADDTPLSGVELILDTGERVQTGRNGEYLFDNIIPGDHVLTVDPRSLENGIRPIKDFYMLNLMEGAREYLDVPITAKDEGTINGKVSWIGQNESTEKISLNSILLILDAKYSVTADENGTYIFNSVGTGEHTIEIESKSIPDGLMVKGENKVKIEVKKAETVTVNYELSGNPWGQLTGLLYSDADLKDLHYPSTVFTGFGIYLNGERIAITDSDGKFDITYLLPGKYTISLNEEDIKKANLKAEGSISEEIQIEAGLIQTIRFKFGPLKLLRVNISLQGVK